MPYGPDALLRRRATAEALIAAGFPVRPATLATMASRGGGPPYRVFGRIPLYRLADALAWAESRLSPPRRSSSEGELGPSRCPASAVTSAASPAHPHTHDYPRRGNSMNASAVALALGDVRREDGVVLGTFDTLREPTRAFPERRGMR